jgi:hypothetical protein
MKTTRKFYVEWRYYLLLSGILIIVISEMDTIDLCKFVLLYSVGFLLAFSGGFILWKDRPWNKMEIPGGTFLGTIHLNGYKLHACEMRADNGQSQFRLLSDPKLNPRHEAAFIRYLVTEGLIEGEWPQLVRRITSESDWAFLP